MIDAGTSTTLYFEAVSRIKFLMYSSLQFDLPKNINYVIQLLSKDSL